MLAFAGLNKTSELQCIACLKRDKSKVTHCAGWAVKDLERAYCIPPSTRYKTNYTCEWDPAL